MSRILVICAICALAACSDAGTPAPEAEAGAPPARKTVVDGQLQALEQAKAVGEQLEEEKARTDQAIEDQGG